MAQLTDQFAEQAALAMLRQLREEYGLLAPNYEEIILEAGRQPLIMFGEKWAISFPGWIECQYYLRGLLRGLQLQGKQHGDDD